MIAAQQYFIEFGTDMSADRLMNLLPNYIPDYCLTGDKPVEHWHALIMQAFKKSYYVKERVPDLKAKEDVVSYAKYKWPLLFSRFYEAFRYSGRHLIIFTFIFIVCNFSFYCHLPPGGPNKDKNCPVQAPTCPRTT